MLRKGSSITKLCLENPSYTGAVSKTFYGKKNLASLPVSPRLNDDDSAFAEVDMNFTFKSKKQPNFMSRNRRNKSVAMAGAINRASDLEFSQVSLDQHLTL